MDIRIPDYIARGERVLSTECILCQHCVVVCPPNALHLSAALDLSRTDRLEIDTASRSERPSQTRERGSARAGGGNQMIRTRTPTHAAEIVLIGVLVLEGVLALGGGVMLVADPSGGPSKCLPNGSTALRLRRT